MQLYKIADEYSAAIDELSSMEELTPQIIADSLAPLRGEVEDKSKAVASFALNLDADIKTLKDHEEAIQSRRKALENRRDFFREYLRDNMERCGITKIESPYFNVTLTKPSTKVLIEDAEFIPDDCVKVKREPVKADIKRRLESGEDIPGAHLVKGKSGLRIK